MTKIGTGSDQFMSFYSCNFSTIGLFLFQLSTYKIYIAPKDTEINGEDSLLSNTPSSITGLLGNVKPEPLLGTAQPLSSVLHVEIIQNMPLDN